MVGVHFGELPDAPCVRVVPDCAQGAVRDALLLRVGGLPRIDGLRLLGVEYAHFKKPRVLFAAEDVFEVEVCVDLLLYVAYCV